MFRIPPKFGSGLKTELVTETDEKGLTARLKKKKAEREALFPHLEELVFLYHHNCDIFMPTDYGVRYVKGYGNYRTDRDEDYDKVGQILAQI